MVKNEDILRSLGRLEGKCDAIIESLKDHTGRMNRIDEDIEDLRDDIGKVKEKVSTIDKKQYAIIAVATLVWGVIVALIRKFL